MCCKKENFMKGKFEKKYSVAIDTVPLPEKPNDRIELAITNY